MGRSKRRKFYGNRFKTSKEVTTSVPGTSSEVMLTCSEKKLQTSQEHFRDVTVDKKELTGFRITDIEILISILSILLCPECKNNGLYLVEDSIFGLCSNFCLYCKNCPFSKGFSSSKKQQRNSEINTRFVFALRIIGKGFTAAKKLCAKLNLPAFLSKVSFRIQELKLLHASVLVAENSMKHAAGEIRNADDPVPSVKCGVSVDGTWQRRGYSSLNGVVRAISILSGKVIDMEVMSQFCKKCYTKTSSSSFALKHQCANHKGSSGNMEVIGAYRIFERSVNSRGLIYSEYFGDGDSKGYDEVKDIYGTNSVVKCECIVHVQKLVGTHL
ncbi:hypothetical protein AVEN_89836-1 [Araneus ventricosus]|uniref:Mutator-like transposase domain-containing protein n=1 Tax=Araneus ventricosus TaxID=182803 RepID=A0A4Y2MJ70_ARAVE|nr:hypothetical protein AVEN_89836-1 [Araneus ventricosus]